jgi:large subunit ribosomal protein L25
MTASSELNATPREVVGKANRRLGAASLPAVLYGTGRDPMAIAVDRHDFEMFLASHSAGSTLVELRLEGEKKPINAMIRDIQHSPIKGTPLHVDFLAVEMNKIVSAVVTLHFVNDSAGVRAGGTLTVNMHEVNVEAKPGDLPEGIDVDIEHLELGDSLLVSAITAPDGVTITDDPEAVVASVQAPRAEIEEESDTEVVEPEVIGEKPANEE